MMNTRSLLRGYWSRGLMAAFLAAGTAIPVSAHHGWSAYDSKKTIIITAVVRNVQWRNPHAEAIIDHEGKAWTVVLAPIARMQSRGLTAEMLKDGVSATLEGYPRSDGTPEMRLERITVSGKTVELR